MKLVKSIVAGVMLVGALVSAQAFAAFEDPQTASWGGWSRGDAGTLSIGWDDFDLAGNAITPPYGAADTTPDTSINAAFSGVVPFNGSTIVTGTNNLYTPGGPGVFQTYAVADNLLAAGPISVALQIRSLGTPLDSGSVSLTDGVTFSFSPDTTSLLTSEGGAQEWLFLWDLPADVTSYGFMSSATGSHMSLDALSLDIGPSPVPVPAAAWLFGSALAGLAALRRKKA